MALNFTEIGKRIQNARRKNGLTQEELAEKLDISRNQLASLEIGTRGTSLELFVKIANELSVPITNLLEDYLKPDIYYKELQTIFQKCTDQEKRIITGIAKTLWAILRKNGI